MFRISALSLPFRRPRDLQQFSEHATFVSICNSCPHKQHIFRLAICPHLHHLFAHATFGRTCTILPSSIRFPSSASGISPTFSCILDACVQLSLLRWLGTAAGTSYFSLLQLVASSSIFRLMLFPHLPIYVRAFRGPVGACVRLCLGDSSRAGTPTARCTRGG